MANDWADGFKKQARSDFSIAELLLSDNVSGQYAYCHLLHYLQMTVEKLGKAHSQSPNQPPAKNHKGGKQLFIAIKRNPNNIFNRKIRRPRDYASILKTVAAIEALAPALAGDGPNAEYPWESPDKRVIPPCEHNFLNDPNLSKQKIAKLVTYLSRVFTDR